MQGIPSFLSADDVWYFNEGTHFRLYEKLGAHPRGGSGTAFAVWAPNAVDVCVIGSFNGWDRRRHPLSPVACSGIWAGFVPEARRGDLYKYFIRSRYGRHEVEKADPFAFLAETPPKTASIIWDLDYHWSDGEWMEGRKHRRLRESPVSIYEVHLQSWRLNPEENNRPLTYRELAIELAGYVSEMGFTHVEFMPVMEHPRPDSWGYKTTGYFAPCGGLGDPQDLMYLIDCLHRRGIGVILDWSPAHFALDGHGLSSFDGTHLYDHHDDRLGFHPEWGTRIFNYGRHEVRSFLSSVAFFWLEKYHVDGLRVDAVSSMLYRDYARQDGQWIPNHHGGNENWEAAHFLQRLNREIYRCFPGVETFAEESTAWPRVTHPADEGGLGFGFKWDMGWMNDTLRYMSKDPVYRQYDQNDLTFRGLYVSHESFLLPLSHDEVTQGKGSLLRRMPRGDWEKLASLRLLYGYMYSLPGKKLLFMGCEFGQWDEWAYDQSVGWHLRGFESHSGMARRVGDLNRLYTSEPALYETDSQPVGFEWVDCRDVHNSVISFLRRSEKRRSLLLGVFSFTPVVREHYRVGVPESGLWREVLNSDSRYYCGTDCGNLPGVQARHEPWHDRCDSIVITLPPLSALIFKHEP